MPTDPRHSPLRWIIAFIFLILLAHELHELVHTGVGRMMCGAWGPRDFNVWSLAPGCDTWVPTLAGPLVSWAVMWAGAVVLRRGDPAHRWLGLALAFAPNPLGRLLPALVGGGDEGVVARALVGSEGPWARLLVIVAAALIVVPPLVIAWRHLPAPWRWARFLLLFAAGILVTGPILFLLGNTLLQRGVLAEPGLLGAPALVELFTLIAAAGFALTWRGLRSEMLPPATTPG